MPPTDSAAAVLPVAVVAEPGPPPDPTRAETLLARVMFALAALDLLLTAGLVHRAREPGVTALELEVLSIGLGALWPVFAAEAAVGLVRRGPGRPLRPGVLRAVLVLLFPPFRMGSVDPRTGLVWLPRLGWERPGKDLYNRIDRAFGGPMILVALLILPVLGIEYLQAERVKNDPDLALALHIGAAVIWVAFATEFVLESSVHPKPLTFLKQRWLDLAIVVLPALEVILTRVVDAAPLARLLRLGRALSPEQLTAVNRAYRLRGLMMKGWQAFLLVGGVNRFLGNAGAARLRAVEAEIAELEDRLAELRKEAEGLRAKAGVPDTPPPGPLP
ncbi:MAG: hypothetical protein K2X82_33290 [Gemmataceae bacterium]|nr:hypothetical protein [Gemmataceae bacterium]